MTDDPPNLTSAALHILVAIGPEERHGYAVMREVDRMTDGSVRLAPGTLYVTIKRLVSTGLIEETDERPDPSLDDQRRRYYRLTMRGRAVVASEVARLESLVKTARPWAMEGHDR
jgi:DNA-binding PadR family transcriptional regulator